MEKVNHTYIKVTTGCSCVPQNQHPKIPQLHAIQLPNLRSTFSGGFCLLTIHENMGLFQPLRLGSGRMDILGIIGMKYTKKIQKTISKSGPSKSKRGRTLPPYMRVHERLGRTRKNAFLTSPAVAQSWRRRPPSPRPSRNWQPRRNTVRAPSTSSEGTWTLLAPMAL